MNYQLSRLTALPLIRKSITLAISIGGLILSAPVIIRAEAADPGLVARQVNPLYNWRWRIKKSAAKKISRKVNPAMLSLPLSAQSRLLGEGDAIHVSGAPDEYINFGISITNFGKSLDVSINLSKFIGSDEPLGIEGNLKIVTSWAQSGKYAAISKRSGFITYELLLDDDRNVVFRDSWRRDGDGWVYQPPEVARYKGVRTRLAIGRNKRILSIVKIPADAAPGEYRGHVEVVDITDSRIVMRIPVQIEVLPFILSEIEPDQYALYAFTGFVLDPSPGIKGSYVNAQRMRSGRVDAAILYSRYLADIRSHGFNGVTFRDWRARYMRENLSLIRETGFHRAILHASTPVPSENGGERFPIVSENAIAIFKEYNFQPWFFGFDEDGGNSRLDEQIALNVKVHQLQGRILNAVFWKDREAALRRSRNTNLGQFDSLAYSMGSNGFQNFFSSLPMSDDLNYSKYGSSSQFGYWHPHIETPTRNRMFMGFWIWASGLSGVIPHGYFFPAHIEKALTDMERRRGTTTRFSPYDDWSFWLPPGNLRHHATVYPAKDGPVGTLQWEGIRAGVTDLRYLVTLERAVADIDQVSEYADEVRTLFSDIRSKMLDIRKSSFSDVELFYYQKQMDRWRAEIQEILIKICMLSDWQQRPATSRTHEVLLIHRPKSVRHLSDDSINRIATSDRIDLRAVPQSRLDK